MEAATGFHPLSLGCLSLSLSLVVSKSAGAPPSSSSSLLVLAFCLALFFKDIRTSTKKCSNVREFQEEVQVYQAVTEV